MSQSRSLDEQLQTSSKLHGATAAATSHLVHHCVDLAIVLHLELHMISEVVRVRRGLGPKKWPGVVTYRQTAIT